MLCKLSNYSITMQSISLFFPPSPLSFFLSSHLSFSQSLCSAPSSRPVAQPGSVECLFDQVFIVGDSDAWLSDAKGTS